MEKSPRAHTRQILDRLRSGESEATIENNPIKAEVYAICAYFIEKATKNADTWLQAHPNQGLYYELQSQENTTVRSTITHVEDIQAFLQSTNLDIILQRISFLIEGLLHQQVLAVMNPDFPATLVNEADEDIQERLRSLLLQFRDGSTYHARDFVLSATRAPAIFIPPALHAGMVAYQSEYKRIPAIEELEHLTAKLTPLILKLAQHNIRDIVVFNRKHFGIIGPGKMLPVRAFDHQITLEADNNTYQFRFPEVEQYKNTGTVDEPTIGCPAVYSLVNSQNAIRYMVRYATDLLRQSGIYKRQ